MDRNLRLEHLEEMPRNSFSFAIFISCEVELVNALEKLLEMRYLFSGRVGDDVDRCEPVIDVDSESSRLPQVPFRGWEFGCTCGDVANMTHRRLDDEVVTEVFVDRARLGRRLNDDEFLGHCSSVPRG